MEIRPPFAIVLPIVPFLDKKDEKLPRKIVLCSQIDDRSIFGCMVNRLDNQIFSRLLRLFGSGNPVQEVFAA